MSMVPSGTERLSYALSAPRQVILCLLPHHEQADSHFIPDFAESSYGEYGHRDWYDYHVFAGRKM